MSDRDRNSDEAANGTTREMTSEFRQMIDEEVRQIELHGGETVHQLKSTLYEKWVSELLDTIAVMSKHTLELEKVASSSVSKLEQKLLDSADTSHNFMQTHPNRFTSTKLADSGLGRSNSHHQTSDSGYDTRELLTKRLQESSEFAKMYLTKCNELESKIEALEAINSDLKGKLLEKEESLIRMRSTSPEHSNNLEQSQLQSSMDAKVRELAQETSQRKRLEKRVCKQSEEIKALTQEVAAKHDQVLQQEQRTREVQQQMDKLLAQNNYQNLLIESLRKENKKQKLAENKHSSSTPNIHSPRKTNEAESKDGDAVKIVVEHQNDQSQEPHKTDNETNMNKDQVCRLQMRLEELETKLKGKEELISKLQVAAGPSRSQTLTRINKMSPDELKLSLLNKQKEISEQRIIIGQLQEALIDSKNRFDGLHKSGDHADDMQLSIELSCQLSEAKRQLRFYEEHNRDLSLEVMRTRNDKTESELQLEQILKEKGADLTEKEEQIKILQDQIESSSKEVVDHSTCAQQIATLQNCLEEGAKMLKAKNEQILELQIKLDELCREAEEQLKVLSSRNANLAKLEESLRDVRRDRDGLLQQMEILKEESQREKRQGTLKNELEESLKKQLRQTDEELNSWKERYEIISRNLEQKERFIEEMRRRHEEETSQAMVQTVNLEKLALTEAEADSLRSQLTLVRSELSEIRTKYEAKAAEAEKLRLRLELEKESSKGDKEKAQKLAAQAEEQSQRLQQMQLDMDARTSTFKVREDEMKRLLRLSCENVEHLQALNLELGQKAETAERLEQRVLQLEAAKKEAHLSLKAAQEEVDRLQNQLEASERDAAEAKERLGQFEAELVRSAERVAQLQGLLVQAQQERQQAADEAANLRAQLAEQALAHQTEQAEMTSQLQSAQIEKQHLERSLKQLEDLCKTLSAQLGGQRHEREKYVRGLKQASAERSQMCQEARQVLAVAREWLAEHRAGAMELHQLKSERERLLKENNALRHRSRTSTSMLNPWDCGLVDREESGFWSSHWTTQLDEVDQEIETIRRRTESWGDAEEEDEDVDGVEGRGDNGYQSGYQSGSSK